MEEGGEKCLSNKCNKDYLATAKDKLEAKVETDKQWLVCGFNGFGQFKFENKRKLQQFEELSIDNKDIMVACSWTCLVFANGCSLRIEGFISNAPKSVKLVETETPIKSIDICDKYCLVLLENGKVYKVLLKYHAKLEEIIFQTNSKQITPKKRTVFGDYKPVKFLKISHIACGNNITVAVSNTNQVFSGVTEIYKLPKHERLKQLVCGIEHALLLTVNGDIYAWGNGLRGQLGLEVLRVEENLTLIEALAGVKIISVAAGGWHSAAISAFGDVYTWGFNLNGQLGLRLYKTETQTIKEPSVYTLPQIIELPTCQNCNNANNKEKFCYPLKVVCGGRHTILQMSCGAIFASGWNKYGQLGLKKSQEYWDSFQFVLKLGGKNNVNDNEIICGNWCTLIKK